MDSAQHDQLVWLITNRQHWRILNDGEDENGPYIAAWYIPNDQAHQFRSTDDWDVNGRLIERGEGGGNLGQWSKRASQDIA